MAAPTNTSPAAATDLGTLPASLTQTVDDAGTTYTVWYRYTATDDDVALGLFGYGDLSVYKVRTQIYDNVAATGADLIVDTGGGGGANRPVQFAVTPGTTYYAKFTPNAGNPSPALLTLSVESFAQQSVPVGSIAVNDDAQGYPLVMVSAAGEVIRFLQPFPSGEAGDVLDDGTFLASDLYDDNLTIYDNQLNVVVATPVDGINIASFGGVVRTCQGTQRWWYAYDDAGSYKVRFIEADGTQGTPHVLGAVTGGVGAIAVNNDETILYYAPATGVSTSAIKRFDLVTDLPLSDLAAHTAGYAVFDILIHSDDSILASRVKSSATADVLVRRYDAAGSTLNTYSFGSAYVFPDGTFPRLAYAIDQPNSFWIWTHPDGADEGVSRFQNIKVSDGSTLATVEVPEYEGGVYVPAVSLTPLARYGVSFSCPFWITRVLYPAASGGTIRVVKIVNPSSDPQTFDFSAGGGLTPTSFSLGHADEQVFNSVPVGDGYSVEETANPNYQTTVTVSNGSPVTNISVEEDETVVVTFTNSAVFGPDFNTRIVKRRWLRRSPIYSHENQRTVWDLFQLDIQPGVGNANEPGLDPQVFFRHSADAGQTWSSLRQLTAGKRGKYDTQVQFWRLGQARNMVLEVSGSDPVPVALIDGFAKVRPGTDGD